MNDIKRRAQAAHSRNRRSASRIEKVFAKSLDSACIRQSIVAVSAVVLVFFGAASLWAATGGSITGTVTDPSGAVIAGAALKLVNTAQQTIYRTISDKQGSYSLPNLPVGQYNLTVTANGFTSERKTNLVVYTDSALRVDATLKIGAQSQTVMVTSSEATNV